MSQTPRPARASVPPTPAPEWTPPPTTAEQFATATDPGERDRLLQREFEETPTTRLRVVNLVDEVVFERADAWKYDEDDSAHGYHIGGVELLGERRWFVWDSTGYQVDNVQLCTSREDAAAKWREVCISQSDIYFDDWEYEEDPDLKPRTQTQMDARVDRAWPFFARATGLPEDVSREMLRARVDAQAMADVTGGNPDLRQLNAYRTLAALRANPSPLNDRY